MLRIAVIDDYMRVVADAADWASLQAVGSIDFYHDHLIDEDQLVARLSAYDVIVAERERTPFPASLFARLPRLKLLVATGIDNWVIDFAAAARHGVVISCTGSVMAAMPELAWGLILSLSRRITWDHIQIRAGGWQTQPGRPLQGATLGILGLGVAGKRMLDISRAFGMKTVAWSQNLSAEAAQAAGTQRVEFDELLRSADVITIQLVLSERTRGLIGAREFGLMKRDALLVNTSRGPIIDEAALIDALKTRRIGGAGLDVYAREPLPRDHPLRSLDNVVLTPHTGYITEQQVRVFYGQAVENIIAFARGTPMRVMTAPYSAELKKQLSTDRRD